MHRCYLAPERWQDGVLIPDREECHHMRDVLRVVPGDVVMLFDGAGRRVKAQVLPPATPEIKLEPLGEIELLSRPLPSISLMQAIPKGSRMETVVEKGTELGMNRLVPVVTARTITRLDEARARKRCQRWTRIALSATKQCGVSWLPVVERVQNLEEALSLRPRGDVLLVGALSGNPQPMAEVVDGLAASPPPSVSLLVGPEGDLTPEEMEMAQDAGGVGIHMGPLVLRTDTAALFGLSVLSSRLRARAAQIEL